MDKKIMPKELVPNDLVGVSPMVGPTGEFWETIARERMKNKWEMAKDEILLGDFPNTPKKNTRDIIL